MQLPHCNVFLYTLLILHSTISCLSANNTSSDILYDVSPYVIVYANGTVSRLSGNGFVPASTDPTTGVQSKDVTIDPSRPISARLFRSGNPLQPWEKLPLLVYFHGGAFMTASPSSPTYHNYLNSVVAKANVIAMSVNYRLAPENPLPTGYEDSWLALEWAFSHSNGNGTEPWLRFAVDFNRVYIGGDSAGGNIAHNVAMRAGLQKTGRVVITGMFLNCPHFWGNKPIGDEGSNIVGSALMEKIWLVAYPNAPARFDNPASNPGMDPNLNKLGCIRVLVFVADEDVLKNRGLYYVRKLRESGWVGDVKAVVMFGEGHVFNLDSPKTKKAEEMMNDVVSFVNRNDDKRITL